MKGLNAIAHWKQIAWSGPLFLLVCILIVAHFRSGTVTIQARVAPEGPTALTQTGFASWYGLKYQGRPTASGESFDVNQLTAAHPTYAFGTRVRVTNLKNNRTVVVRINDRGPSVSGRIIDLSLAAADQLDMVQSGVATVKIEVVP